MFYHHHGTTCDDSHQQCINDLGSATVTVVIDVHRHRLLDRHWGSQPPHLLIPKQPNQYFCFSLHFGLFSSHVQFSHWRGRGRGKHKTKRGEEKEKKSMFRFFSQNFLVRRSVSRNLGSVWKGKNGDFLCYYDARLDADDRTPLLSVASYGSCDGRRCKVHKRDLSLGLHITTNLQFIKILILNLS